MDPSGKTVSLEDKFVTDFFRLGARAWVHAYWNVQRTFTAEEFAQRIHELGLELQFLDARNWTLSEKDTLPCYLVHEPEQERYAIYTVDRGSPYLEGAFATLREAIVRKTELLFGHLDLVKRLKG